MSVAPHGVPPAMRQRVGPAARHRQCTSLSHRSAVRSGLVCDRNGRCGCVDWPCLHLPAWLVACCIGSCPAAQDGVGLRQDANAVAALARMARSAPQTRAAGCCEDDSSAPAASTKEEADAAKAAWMLLHRLATHLLHRGAAAAVCIGPRLGSHTVKSYVWDQTCCAFMRHSTRVVSITRTIGRSSSIVS